MAVINNVRQGVSQGGGRVIINGAPAGLSYADALVALDRLDAGAVVGTAICGPLCGVAFGAAGGFGGQIVGEGLYDLGKRLFG